MKSLVGYKGKLILSKMTYNPNKQSIKFFIKDVKYEYTNIHTFYIELKGYYKEQLKQVENDIDKYLNICFDACQSFNNYKEYFFIDTKTYSTYFFNQIEIVERKINIKNINFLKDLKEFSKKRIFKDYTTIILFFEIETILKEKGMLNKNNYWVGHKITLAVFIDKLIKKDFFCFNKYKRSYSSSNSFRYSVRRFFEKRYNIILKKEFEKKHLIKNYSNHPFTWLSNLL